jgi:hypothetical protein
MFRSEGVWDPRLCLVNAWASVKNAGHRPIGIKLINRVTRPITRAESLFPSDSGLKLAKAGLIRRCFLARNFISGRHVASNRSEFTKIYHRSRQLTWFINLMRMGP